MDETEPAADTSATGSGDFSQPGVSSQDDLGQPIDFVQPSDFGQRGQPMSRRSPLYFGFVAALGALLAYGLVRAVGRLSEVITLIVIAAFLALGLDPLVGKLQRRGLPRGAAVAVVAIGVALVFGGFAAIVLPTVIKQANALRVQAPDLVEQLRRAPLVLQLDKQYGIISRLSDQLQAKLSNSDTVFQLFGGLLGAGKALVSGVVSTITVLVLTLYFLASLRTIADTGYRLVPASRRERVRLLGDEIIRRVGGYVAGQVSVAAINGTLTFVLVSVLGLPYAAVLAIIVGLLGLIPLFGATLGAVVVVLVGLFQSWQDGVIIAVYYVIYQQLENYVISPRIMSRTVAVPGGVALVAALAGGTLLGVVGALIAVPIAAAILLILQEVVLPRQDSI